jgi:hypothetical protein
LGAALFLAGASDAEAQPTLNLKRIVNNWPTIEVYFSAACKGQPAYFTDKKYFRVYEEGTQVRDFELWCPDPMVRCAVSLSLVFDASGRMSGEGNAGAKEAGKTLIDLLDGVSDESAVVFAGDVVSVPVMMTSGKELLRAAVDALPASGGAAIWDGIYIGLQELLEGGVNPCRAIIALSSGVDDVSSHTPEELISYANRNRIRIFTVGLGSTIESKVLQNIADLTGGRYYQTPVPSQMTAIYQEISTIIFQGFQECIITYQASCMDGSFRKVDLSLVDFCDGQDTKTKQYKAPRDSSTYQTMRVRLGDVVCKPLTKVAVPLLLQDVTDNTILYPPACTIRYDEKRLRFERLEFPPGSLLASAPYTLSQAPGAVTVRFTERVGMDARKAPSTLAALLFTATDVNTRDSVFTPVEIDSFAFSGGCLVATALGGRVCILAGGPEMSCLPFAPALSWDAATHQYGPSPFAVTATFRNSGDRPVLRPRYRIEYDTSEFRLLNPISNTQASTLATVEPQQSDNVAWQLVPWPRAADKVCTVAITASFDNHDALRCEKQITVPRAQALLGCTLEVAPIAAIDSEFRYEPMPFAVTLTARNLGTLPSDTVRGRLLLPAGLEFAPPDSGTDGSKLLQPVQLAPAAEASARWMLRHASVTVTKRYTVRCELMDGNTPQNPCGSVVTIPALLPQLRPAISAKGATAICAGEQVLLDAGAGYAFYQWSSGETSSRIWVRNAGVYTVTVRDTLGRSATSAPVTVTVYPKPPAPTITRKGDLLTTQAGYAHQWYKDGQKLPGDTAATLRLVSTGMYRVDAISEHGCISTSGGVAVGTLAVPPAALAEALSMDVFPDPVKNDITIVVNRTNGTDGKRVRISIFDASGRAVVADCEVDAGAGNPMTINLKEQPSGLYFVTGTSGGATVVRKFMKIE